MKALIHLIVWLPVLVLGQAKTAEELRTQDMKKYAIESGEIMYKITGDASGSEEMTFTNFGWTSLRKQTMTFELYGITSTKSVHEITDGDHIYRLNYSDSTYTVRKDFKWSQQASYKTPDQVSEAILFSMGGQRQEDTQLDEKTCQVWTFEGKAIQELWIWNGLVMKRKTKLGDRLIETTATAVRLNIEANPILFTFPSYYQKKD